MEGFVAQKLHDFENGKISRRRLIETLTLAATTVYAGGAGAAESPGLTAALVNHISYTCADYKKAADWYSKVFGLDQVGATDHDVALPFGKKGEQPYNVAAKDVPLTHLGAPRPKSSALIDHVAYTIADFDRDKASADLKAMGVENVRNGGPYSLHMTDAFGYDVQISGLANNALTDG